MRKALKDLTLKQAAFAPEYVRAKGNGTKAAKAVGYGEKGAHVAASRLLRNRKVVAEIVRLTRKHEISADRALTRLDNLSLEAEKAGNHSAAIKAEELLGKSLGMWVERSENLHVTLGGEHLLALRTLMDRRKEGGE